MDMPVQKPSAMIVLGLLAAALAGCGGSSGHAKSAAAPPSSTAAATTSTSAADPAVTATIVRRTHSRSVTASATTTLSSIDTAQLQQRTLAALQRYVICIRHHGVPNMPPPRFGDPAGVFDFQRYHVDLNSPKFKAAVVTCRPILIGTLFRRAPSGTP